MHGDLAMAKELVAGIANGAQKFGDVDIAVCPPFTLLAAVAGELGEGRVTYGGQNVSEFEKGAYTGEVSAAMLAEMGCQYVIVGHSERRHGMGETAAQVAAKARAALGANLVPIVCVGELLEARKNNETESVIGAQLDTFEIADLARCVIAYEPVWAIGTGESASPEQAQAVHAYIRERVGAAAQSIKILYGGSVKPDNAAELFAMPDVDGGLIGGASLNADDFLKICAAA